jgi:hypothetical protein
LGTVSGASKCRIKANLGRTRRYAGNVPPLPSDHLVEPFVQPATTAGQIESDVAAQASRLANNDVKQWSQPRVFGGAVRVRF